MLLDSMHTFIKGNAVVAAVAAFLVIAGLFMPTLAAHAVEVPSDVPAIGDVNNLFQRVAGLLVALAASLALIFLVLAGIKYIVAGGDSRQIEEAKQSLIYAGIGLGIALSASLLSRLVEQLVSPISGTRTAMSFFMLS